MKKQNKVILISIGFILVILVVLSFLPLFPSHPFRCEGISQIQYLTGPPSCPNKINFWQYIIGLEVFRFFF